VLDHRSHTNDAEVMPPLPASLQNLATQVLPPLPMAELLQAISQTIEKK
jgi:hypothetical protein